MAYSTLEKLELMFGRANIQRWADLDGDRNAVAIAERVTERLLESEEYINERMVQGRYTVPFSPVPRRIVVMTTLFAGVLLYDGRQIAGSREMRDEVVRHRKEFTKYLREILRGQLKLIHPTSGEAITPSDSITPTVVDSGYYCASCGYYGSCGYNHCVNTTYGDCYEHHNHSY